MTKWFKRIVLGGIALVVGLLFLGMILPSHRESARVKYDPDPPADSTPAAPANDEPAGPTWDKSPDAVAKRVKLVETLQVGGVFGDLRVADGVGTVVVGPAFDSLDFKAKSGFASVAFAWCLDHDPHCIALILRDPRTNKEVGRYSLADAGLKME
jgi:hypothetical protein